MPLALTLTSFLRPDASSVIKRVSTTADGTQANEYSEAATLSPNGRYVLFRSDASNLVAGDTNNAADIFLKDLETGEVMRLSAAADGTQANAEAEYASFSADGRFVVFQSAASNLVAGDTNNTTDIFRKDLVTGEVVRVSAAADGTQANSYSAAAKLSADGRYVVFQSVASNLVAADTNNTVDIFRKDLVTGEVVRVSAAADGTQANSDGNLATLSADGRYVVFQSAASNLVADDTYNTTDIFRKDLETGEVVRVSAAADGTQANAEARDASFSADGRFVVFASRASNLVAADTNNIVDIFRKDLVTGEVVRVSAAADGSQANSYSNLATLSADGRYVVFQSAASNLVAGDTNDAEDIFRKDLVTGEVVRVSAAADGTQSNSYSNDAILSADGRLVLFQSKASNLVAGDTNNAEDIFLVDIDHLADAPAITVGHFVELSLSVGVAWSVSLAWGDGTVSTVFPRLGIAAFDHTYATTGTKSVLATVVENGASKTVAYRIDLAAGTMTRNTAIATQIKGGAAKDILAGDAFADWIAGGSGNDVLNGSKGNDVLSGGTGKDTFVFNATLNKYTNKDKILDWNYRDDTVQLENAMFKMLKKTGTLSKGFFVSGSKALQADDFVGYNKTTGDLWYDANGNKAGGQVVFANIGKYKAIAYNDFVVI